MSITKSRLPIGAAVVLLALQPVLQAASSLPAGGAFTAGSGRISASGSTLVINQNTFRGIIDWNTFSIGQGASVNFRNGAGATLNRVTGSVPTNILGQLSASGSIYLLNPQGILIGHGSVIHTGGDFLASTLNLADSSFLSNALQFTGNSGATVVNLGSLTSTGGNIYLIGHSVQNAGSIAAPQGTVGLAAGSQVLITDSSNGQKVSVLAAGGDLTNSGFIQAAQAELKTNGGNIYALAGNNGGAITATGTADKDGHVWLIAANGTTEVGSRISATNVDGAGGAIETSGAHVVTTNAAHIITGQGGNWLLDPADLLIDATLAGTIENSLATSNVTEQTTASGTAGTGDITVASNITWASGNSLTLSAYKDIILNAGISNTGAGNLTLRADNTSSGTGTISGAGVINFSGSTGNVALLYNPSSYSSPTSYAANFGSVNGAWTPPADASVSSQYTAYMLVNNVTNLQNIENNFSSTGIYALGTDIDASSNTNFQPIAAGQNFQGILDGMGHTIDQFTISNHTTSDEGIFSQVGPNGIVRNLNMTNVSIGGPSGSFKAGAIVGSNIGTIVNDTSSGTILAGSGSSILRAGGLVGSNDGGTIKNSSSSVTVADSSLNGIIGGLVGYNDVGGTITGSSATGSVTNSNSNNNSHAGGLVGFNSGTISNSSAAGAVSGVALYAGGLVGENNTGATITNSSSSGAVTDNAEYEGGLVGSNEGTITNSSESGALTTSSGAYYEGGLAGFSNGPISGSHASGAVSSTSYAYLGGLVGLTYSGGTIVSSYATGNVTGVSGSPVGGLVGDSQDSVTSSYATGNVTSGNTGYTGGLIGYAQAAIISSYASGSATNGAYVGGLTGANTAAITGSYATGAVFSANGTWLGGLSGESSGPISASHATGYVSSTTDSYIGGLVGQTMAGGTVDSSWASGSLTGGAASDIGGLVGRAAAAISGSHATGGLAAGTGNDFILGGLVGQTDAGGTITTSFATGSVIADPAAYNPFLGGLVGESNAAITQSYETGSVSGGNTAYSGGLVGFQQFGPISTSYAMGSVSGGDNSDLGGLVGISLGTLTDTYARGSVTGGATSVVGGLTGESGTSIATSYSSGLVTAGSGSQVGGLIGSNGSTTITSSYWDNTVNPTLSGSGAGSSSGALGESTPTLQAGTLPGGFNPSIWTAPAGVYPYFGWQGALVTVSGIAYNSSLAPIADASVDVTAGGILRNTVTANGSGFYTITEPSNMLPTSTGVLTYLSNNFLENTYSDGANGFTGMNLFNNTLTLMNGTHSTLSSLSADLMSTVGGSLEFPASVVNNILQMHSGNLSIQSTVPAFTIDQSISRRAFEPTFRPGSQANSVPDIAAQGGYVLINSAGPLTVSTDVTIGTVANSNITLVSDGAFTNHAGAGLFNLSGTSRWFVYSETPLADTMGGLAESFIQYNATYGSATLAQSTGNGLLYTIAPTISPSLTGTVSKIYDGNTAATLSTSNYTYSGELNGDTITLSDPTIGVFTTRNAGTGLGITASDISLISAAHGSIPVYGYRLGGMNASGDIGTINPATLTYLADPASQVFGSANTTFDGTVTGFIAGETLASATTGTAAFNSQTTANSPAGTYAIDGSGLTANHGNYIFTQAPGNASALTITAAMTPTPTPMPIPAPIPSPAVTALTFDITNAVGLEGQTPVFNSVYTGSPIAGVNISQILASLTYQITPALNGPGIYEITATGIAPSGYALKIAPAHFIVVDSTPRTLPTQATMNPPLLTDLLPDGGGSDNNFFQPVNSVGLFQVDVNNTASSFGSSFAGFSLQQTPLSQSSFFNDPDQKQKTYTAGAKP